MLLLVWCNRMTVILTDVWFKLWGGAFVTDFSSDLGHHLPRTTENRLHNNTCELC